MQKGGISGNTGWTATAISVSFIYSSTAKDAYKGGIVGYLSSLNNMMVISDNYFKEGCGADSGIGYIGFVQTSDKNADSTTKKYSEKYGRTDDPTGTDKDKLTKSCTATALTDGTALAKLNSGKNSSKNWVQGTSYPEFTAYGTKHITRITCKALSIMNPYPYVYGSGDILSGKKLLVSYNDGTTKEISATDPSVVKNYTISKSDEGKYVREAGRNQRR